MSLTRLLAAVLLSSATIHGFADAPPLPHGTLTLTNGDSVAGEFRPSEASDAVAWLGKSFRQPFEFPLSAVASVHFPANEPVAKPQGEFVVELLSGDLLTGRIRDWSDEAVVFESTHFDTIRVRTTAVRRLYRIDENPQLIYSGPLGRTGWRSGGTEWKEEGGYLSTDEDGNTLTADLDLPHRAMIEFELSWKATPNFVFAIGVDPNAKSDSKLDGWRFETWGDSSVFLAAVREEQDRADVAAVLKSEGPKAAKGQPSVRAAGDQGINRSYFRERRGDDGHPPRQPIVAPKPNQDRTRSIAEKRVHLIAYLDRTAGTMRVFHPDGELAAEISVPPSDAANSPKGKSGGGVRIVNRHGDIRLERLRIIRWNGEQPSLRGAASQFTLADGTAVSGEIARFDSDSSQLVVRHGTEEHSFEIQKLLTAEMATAGRPHARQVSMVLQDGTHVSGAIEGVQQEELHLSSPDIAETLHVPHTKVRSLTIRPLDAPTTVEPPTGRAGRLEVAADRITGALVDAVETPDSHCLAWHPVGSRTSSLLKANLSGRIVYRDPPPPVDPRTARAAQIRLQQQQRRPVLQLPLGFSWPVANANTPKNPRTVPNGQPHAIHLLSGDAVPCTITAIDEQGVHITSPVAETKLIPHEKIKAAELAPGAAAPNLVEAKKQRLLTVPRSQKASPPTHLLCSGAGDFLRCRLVSLGEDHVRVEVQLAEIEIPRQRLSQIIWFQKEELEAAPEEPKTESPSSEGEDTGTEADATGDPQSASVALPKSSAHLVQAIPPNGNRMTFDAEKVDGQVILGTSDVLGACRVDLSEIDQLIFGEQIDAAAAELAYHQWRLHSAIEPLVAQDFDPDGGAAGTASPLVGQAAPEIDLELVEGGRFKLSQCRSQIVVLDFWATWCGPCIQTMPLTEAAMREFDPAQVRLVAVNLEEPAEHVKSVLERHQLTTSVALDIDGVAAGRYAADAIPQLVIVDREGNVARVYVGGGRDVVEQLKISLTEMLSPED